MVKKKVKVVKNPKCKRNAWTRYAKFGNKRVFDPMYGNFDSELEHHVYIHLLTLQNKGDIHDLKRQVEIEVIPKTMYYKFKQLKTKFKYEPHHLRSIKYIADFTYYDKDGRYHVCDAKGRKTKEYQLKKKILLSLKGIYIEEWLASGRDSYAYKVDFGFNKETDTTKEYWMPKKVALI